MVRPTRIYRPRELMSVESVVGDVSGTDVDWGTSPIGIPASSGRDQWKQPVRVASTASVTVSTALNNGDTIDGVTLVTGDRVLLKDQSTGSQNGIYIVGATPIRAADMDDDDEVLGALVYVIAGTTNTATAWKVTNTSAVTVGSTSIVWAAFGTGGGASFATPAIVLGTAASAGAASTVIRSDATIVAFDATSPADVASSAATGSAAFAPHRDHAHRGVKSLSKSGSAALYGDVTLTGGSNVTLTQSGNDISIASTGGGGSGLTVQYPALKPGTPTYDFAASALDGAFSAHSSGGSFATANCMTQGAAPWPGTTLEMQYNAQMGRLTLAHSNTDLDFTWGGVSYEIGENVNAITVGIAAMNSSGDGILVAAETTNIYFGKIVAYQFTTILASWAAGIGPSTLSLIRTGSMWFRLKRVSGVWTGYASVSGRTWDKTFATDSTAYTIDRLGFGMFYNTASTYNGRILSDYVQVDV